MMRNLLLALIANGAALAANPPKGAVPLFFIANRGQAPPAVRFMAKGSGLTVYFSPGEALFRVAGRSVRMQFEQANPSPRIEGMERLPGHANFLIGAQRNWRPDVPLYGAVAYRELYPGIDMVYGGEGRDLKSEFVVAPGADPSRIRVRYAGAGAGGVRVAEDGALAIPVDGRELREQAPSIYQERSGRRVAVAGRFAVDADGAVRFQVGDYDVARPLIIDPVLSYSTLLGGSGFDSATALAVDSAGAAYVAGFTESYDFPAANPEQNSNAGGNDAFVAKFNLSGNGLVYCTYVGGSADDRAYGIAVDGTGSAYVTGTTISANFPVRNALQSHLAGGRNAFVLKLNPAGNTLVYSTYLGGNASDNGNGIAVDAAGDAYVVGDTTFRQLPGYRDAKSQPWRAGRFRGQTQRGWEQPAVQHLPRWGKRRPRRRHRRGRERQRVHYRLDVLGGLPGGERIPEPQRRRPGCIHCQAQRRREFAPVQHLPGRDGRHRGLP